MPVIVLISVNCALLSMGGIAAVRGYWCVTVLSLILHSDAHMLMEDIKRTVSELEQDSSLPTVGVELVDNELATLYMNSRKSEVTQKDFFLM